MASHNPEGIGIGNHGTFTGESAPHIIDGAVGQVGEISDGLVLDLSVLTTGSVQEHGPVDLALVGPRNDLDMYFPGLRLGCQKTDVVALCWYGQIYSVVWMSPEPDSCRDAHVTKALEEYRSPTHKIIAMLHAGRRKLRLKYAALREELRTAQNQVRAVEASRATWRRRAEDAELQLASLKKSLQLD